MPQVTIPEKNNIYRQAGSLVLTIDDSTNQTANLLKTGPFILKKETNGFSIGTNFSNEQKTLTVATPTAGSKTLIWSWIQNNHRLMVVDNKTNLVSEKTKEQSALNEEFGLIDLAVPSIEVNGLSQQETAPAGHNLISPSATPPLLGNDAMDGYGGIIGWTELSNGIKLTGKRNAVGWKVDLPVNTVVTFSADIVFKDSEPTSQLTVGVNKNKGATPAVGEYYDILPGKTRQSITFTTNPTIKENVIGFASNEDGIGSIEITKMQVVLGSDDVSYAPSQPEMPSPERPSEIVSLNKNFDLISQTTKPEEEHTPSKLKSANLSPFHLENKDLVWNEIKRLKLNTVSVPIVVRFENAQTETMTIDKDSKAKAIDMVSFLRAKSDLLNLIIEPYPLVANGSVSETDIKPVSINNFFYNWELVLEELNTELSPYHIYGLYIASNMVHLEYAEGYWKNLIEKLKKTFKGKVIYRKNWWTTASWAPETVIDYNNKLTNLLFDYVDIIAISAYFELNEDTVSSVTQIESDIHSTRVFGRGQNVFEEVKKFATYHSKPVFFGELGFSNREKSASQPWNPKPTEIENNLAQSNLFEAYGNVFNKEPWFLGSSIFQIGGESENTYTPREEAGLVISRWFPENEDILAPISKNPIYKTKLLLSEPLRSVGDVKDRLFLDSDGLWKVERNVGELILDSGVTFNSPNSSYHNETSSLIGTNTVLTPKTGSKPISSHFASGINGGNGTEVGVATVGNYPFIRMRIENSTIGASPTATAAERTDLFKKWAQGKNIVIQCELATPTIETLPQSEQVKLNLFKEHLIGNVLYASDEKMTVPAPVPYFSGTYEALSIYSQDVLYNEASPLLTTKLKNSGTRLFDADYTQPMHYAKKPFLEATMAPEDNSPILVQDEEGPMQRQYFFDHITGVYKEDNTESFVYRGEDVLMVSYDKLDSTYKTTVKCEGELLGEPITVKGNQVFITMTPEQKEYWYGKTIDVTYRLAKSYTVEYNENTAHDSYLVRLENHQDQEITIVQEGNRFSNQRLMREIELNPIVNPRHSGFMYVSTEEQKSQAFRLNLSSNYIIANGLDSADFIVEVMDQDGNEVLSPYLDVFIMNDLGQITSQFGQFYPVVNKDTLKAKNAAGRSYFKYQAPLIRTTDTKKTQKVFAVAYDRKYKIGAQVPLIIRPSEPVYDITGKSLLETKLPEQTSPQAAIVFEYFARFYEKPVPVNHPILLLDKDKDGALTLTDLNQFLIEQTNASLMQEIAYALRETEAF